MLEYGDVKLVDGCPRGCFILFFFPFLLRFLLESVWNKQNAGYCSRILLNWRRRVGDTVRGIPKHIRFFLSTMSSRRRLMLPFGAIRLGTAQHKIPLTCWRSLTKKLDLRAGGTWAIFLCRKMIP